jgi:hypothetical protein
MGMTWSLGQGLATPFDYYQIRLALTHIDWPQPSLRDLVISVAHSSTLPSWCPVPVQGHPSLLFAQIVFGTRPP